jgi:hypothetical protein
MNANLRMLIPALALFAVVIPIQLFAQDKQDHHQQTCNHNRSDLLIMLAIPFSMTA